MAKASRPLQVVLMPKHEEEILHELESLLDDEKTGEDCAELLAQFAAIASGKVDGRRDKYVHSSSEYATIYRLELYGFAAYYAYGLRVPQHIYPLGFCRASSRLEFYPKAAARLQAVP